MSTELQPTSLAASIHALAYSAVVALFLVQALPTNVSCSCKDYNLFFNIQKAMNERYNFTGSLF